MDNTILVWDNGESFTGHGIVFFKISDFGGWIDEAENCLKAVESKGHIKGILEEVDWLDSFACIFTYLSANEYKLDWEDIKNKKKINDFFVKNGKKPLYNHLEG